MKTEENWKQWKGILVYIEVQSERICSVSMELLAKACEMGEYLQEPVYGVLVGRHVQNYAAILEHMPIDSVCLYESGSHLTSACVEALSSSIALWKPSIVLIGGTAEGRMLAPAMAVRFRTGVTADCIGLNISDKGELIQSRPAFGGNLMADIITGSRPQIATVRTGVVQKKSWGRKYPVTLIYPELTGISGGIQTLNCIRKQKINDIAKQRILVAAGRGIQKKEDLDMIRELASLLGGELASSRGLVEKGWVSSQRQIGLSGQSVSPDILLTVGISGTVQFAAGIKNAKKVISINSDDQAPIFQIAHYPVCGDLYKIVPELISRLKTQKEECNHATVDFNYE